MIKRQLILDEDVRLKPYTCPAGKLTIGVGRNIEDNGITYEEAMMMLDNDITRVVEELKRNLPFYESLDEVRQGVLINMCFNLGIGRLLGFQKTLRHIEDGDYDKASIEMLDSRWAVQVGTRAKRLSRQMRTGEWNIH